MARKSSNDDGTMNAELKNERKAKKRKVKPVGNENEDEVVKPEVKKRRKRKKSKSGEPAAVENSSPKAKKSNGCEQPGSIEEADEPTEGSQTVKEKKPSKRQIKKKKQEIREAEKKDASKQESINKALTYISTWKHARSQWKFEKLKQIWLMDHLLDETLVPESVFPTVLEYFEGCKGMARETLLKKGMVIIKKYEEQQETTSEQFVESVEYIRARQLLQALPTET